MRLSLSLCRFAKRIGSKPLALLTFLAVLLSGYSVRAQLSGSEHWIGTWSTAEVGRPQTPPVPAPALPPFQTNQCPPVPAAAPLFVHFNNQTLRQIVHVSIGGSRVRVALSNAYGTAPLTIGSAHVALRDKGASIQQSSDRALTFSGRPTFTIPAGAVLYSDPVTLTVPDMADVAIDLYLPGSTNTPALLTMHNAAFQTNYVSETGNFAGVATLPMVSTIQNWFLIYQVQVAASDSVGGLVTFGDSITDGTRSKPDTNSRWPDHLVRRMLSQPTPLRMGVMNQGIAGNRVLSEAAYTIGINALARFEHNVLSQPGVTHVIVLEGINDFQVARQNPTPTAEDVIAGHKQLIERAHARGLKIYGGTLTPFYGAPNYTDVGESKRQAFNEWVRTSHVYDAFIDFDKATRDPADPKRLLAEYDSCDHLHPNDAGYKAMAEAIDLGVFRPAPPLAGTTGR